ncbi:hypothetical protein [Bradyrhizobium canariense]|jgi:hypothetical protein|uniref:hypothetical protein n=1 Tax=Bradyrhizobium canariense TaxID=255045 RepID=UPI00025D2D72|nr:hypothetical protein [Bradyrhizobium canariense]EIG62215.1 hypothetical protein Bra1253DRAFT_07108 [Bradyrhizobium sp. WSM1253]
MPGAASLEFPPTFSVRVDWVIEQVGYFRYWPILLQKSAVSDGSFGHFSKDDRL